MGEHRPAACCGTIVFVKLLTKFRNKRIGDPDGVIAVLQIAKRLLSERGDGNLFAALDEALDMAAPKDMARAWWAAHRVIRMSLPNGYDNIVSFSTSDSVDAGKVMDVLDAAILLQGRANIQQSKGKL